MRIRVGVVSFRSPGQSATDRFRYDPLVRGLSKLGYATSYFNPNEFGYDAIILPLKKKPNPFFGIKKKGVAIIGDLTDDMLSYPLTWYNQLGRWVRIFERLHQHRYYIRLLRQCDWVVVGSREQAESFKNYVKGASVVTDAIPDADSQHTASYIHRKPCRLVWFGNVESLYGLTSIQHSLDELARIGDYELHLITSSETKFGLVGRQPRNGLEFMARQQIPCRFHPWSLTTCARDLAGGDIALVPVELGDYYNWRKPAGRVLLAMALGLPVVASAIPSYEAVITPGQTGHIAHSPADWVTYVEQLAQYPQQRQKMGLAARQFALSNYGEQSFVWQYHEVIHRLVSAINC